LFDARRSWDNPRLKALVLEKDVTVTSIRFCFALAIVIYCNPTTAFAQSSTEFHTWATKPPMGWNSWDCYGPTVTEAEVKANADYMAKHLKQHGWEYVVVDIRWYEKFPQRTATIQRPNW
jgi:hypothetical protein